MLVISWITYDDDNSMSNLSNSESDEFSEIQID